MKKSFAVVFLISLLISRCFHCHSAAQWSLTPGIKVCGNSGHKNDIKKLGLKIQTLKPIKDMSVVALESPHTISTTLSQSASVQNPHDLSPQQFVYVVLSSIFVTCLIIADVIGVKLFNIMFPFEVFGYKSVEHTCGMLTFPITFLLGDIINEYFGPKAAKNTVYIGLVMSLLVFAVMNVAQALPYLDKPFNVSKEAFDMIFGSAKIMYIASVVAYLIGSLSDIWLFGVIKRLTRGKYLWLRATGSTIISQVIDSFVVSYIAFSLGKTLTGQVPATSQEVLQIAATGYGLKLFLAAALTPLLYALKHLLSSQFGLAPIPCDEQTEDCRDPRDC